MLVTANRTTFCRIQRRPAVDGVHPGFYFKPTCRQRPYFTINSVDHNRRKTIIRLLIVAVAARTEENAKKYDAEELKEYSRVQEEDADNLEEEKWGSGRKRMVEAQRAKKSQQKSR